MKIVIMENINSAKEYDDFKNIFRIDLRNKNKLDVFIFTTGIYLDGEDNYTDYMTYKKYIENNFYDYLEEQFIKILHTYGISIIRQIYKCIIKKYSSNNKDIIDSYEIMVLSDIPVRKIHLYPYKTSGQGCRRESTELIPIIKNVLENIISLNEEKIL